MEPRLQAPLLSIGKPGDKANSNLMLNFQESNFLNHIGSHDKVQYRFGLTMKVNNVRSTPCKVTNCLI